MSKEDPTAKAMQLRDALRSQRVIYQTIAALSERQGEILLNGVTEEVMRLARAKEEQLGRVDRIDEEIAELKREWPRLREQLVDVARVEVEAELDEVHGVLRRLIELEDRGRMRMEEARTESIESIKRAEDGRRMHTAYSRQHGARPPGSGRAAGDRSADA